MADNQDLQHVYFLPGMAANISIFEHIKLPEDKFKIHYLEWFVPRRRETLESYAKRMCAKIEHEDIALLGVSFGGVVVQEMSKHLDLKRLIIVSSVKSKHELPKRMKWARKTGLYNLVPTSLVNYVHHLEKLPLNAFLKKRIYLYKTYLSISNRRYLNWAIKHMVCWDQEVALPNIVQINGNKDIVFPIEKIKDAIVVEEGTHIMILNKYRWFNKHLPTLIETGKMR